MSQFLDSLCTISNNQKVMYIPALMSVLAVCLALANEMWMQARSCKGQWVFCHLPFVHLPWDSHNGARGCSFSQGPKMKVTGAVHQSPTRRILNKWKINLCFWKPQRFEELFFYCNITGLSWLINLPHTYFLSTFCKVLRWSLRLPIWRRQQFCPQSMQSLPKEPEM